MSCNSQFLRLKELKMKLSLSKGTIYKQIRQGIFPTGRKIGQRAVGWGQEEVQKIINARLAGFSDEQLKLLVKKLRDEDNRNV